MVATASHKRSRSACGRAPARRSCGKLPLGGAMDAPEAPACLGRLRTHPRLVPRVRRLMILGVGARGAFRVNVVGARPGSQRPTRIANHLWYTLIARVLSASARERARSTRSGSRGDEGGTTRVQCERIRI